MIGVARMKRDNAEKDLIEAEARVIQLRNASAKAAGTENNMDVDVDLALELEEAAQALNDCERLVDVASDELQRSTSLYLLT